MARPLRIEFPGALYHVMSRGNGRGRIVRDDVDREQRLDGLRRSVEIYGWRLHAFVLMDNHDPLFVETPEANLSAGMQHLNGSYTGYFNRRHRRVGHLLQGRFKGHLIEVAAALGYGSHGGVHNALKRIESGNAALKQAIGKLAESFTND